MVASFSVCVLHAQDAPKQSAKAANHQESATGCLSKGEEPGGFSLKDESGKTWELMSTNVKLADHVGHTVTVTGMQTKQSKAKEEKMEASEQKEAGGQPYSDLNVTKLKMVSESCK
jgi:hypothetical protein